MDVVDVANRRLIADCQVRLTASELATFRDRLNLLLADPHLQDMAIPGADQQCRIVISRISSTARSDEPVSEAPIRSSDS